MPAIPEDTLSLDNLLRPDVLADPYPFYHQLRSADPVHWDDAYGWVLTRHADVVAVLRDARFSAERVVLSLDWLPEALRETLAPAAYAFMRQMLFLDPPDHTRLRGLVNKAFTPRMVEGMRPRVQEIVDGLLDTFRDRTQVDVIAELAFPLPVVVIAEMLGVPPEDHAQFTRWTADLGALIDGTNLTAERAMRALQGLIDLMDYFRRIIADHRANPRNDLLQGLIAAEDRGDVFSEDELLGNCMLLLAAGHGTTTHLIGNGLLALLRNPDQLQLLRDDPALARSASGRSAPVITPSRSWARPTAIQRSLPTPTGSTSGARRIGTSRSATASTTASAHRSPCSKGRSPLARWCAACPMCGWRPTSWSGSRARPSAACASCRWRWGRGRAGHLGIPPGLHPASTRTRHDGREE